ncbi:MAG: transcriptional initiation protein Tat [Alphaproteobacteria bacterium]|nr:transcriptional initiation protein Tat [Alphaproteobacteria bacterium]MBV8407861.1 transcriptional initiation protein Tat [Alphaproteobacteria bacterium]
MSYRDSRNAAGLSGRRAALHALCAAAAATSALGLCLEDATAATGDYMQPDAHRLRALANRLAALPRRRNFKALPMVITDPNQWDGAALDVLMAYDAPRQVFDTTRLGGSWVNQMRNTVNVQVFSLQRPDFLCVGAPHGAAALALFSQAAWDKYKLAALAGGAFQDNAFLRDPDFPASDVGTPANADGLYSHAGNSVATLQKRGVLFLGCHNAIWEVAATLLTAGVNPDRQSHEELAADLTNNLASGAIVTPGIEATIGRLQEAGFVYSYA